MQSDFYRSYLRSERWKDKKEMRLRVDGYRCVMCGCTSRQCTLQTHHITYKNLGHEDVLNDLVTLCDSCHKKIHNYYNRERGQSFYG